MEAAHCLLSMGGIREFDKGKSARFSTLPIDGQRDMRNQAN
jgi:hypothetical protein